MYICIKKVNFNIYNIMKKYIIIASCDPYNAKCHYHGERVIKYNGPTPVQWVLDDNLGRGFDLKDAQKTLLEMLCNDADYQFKNWGLAVNYPFKSPITVSRTDNGGRRFFSSDVMTYCIEDMRICDNQ